jgi:hypothetical protein
MCREKTTAASNGPQPQPGQWQSKQPDACEPSKQGSQEGTSSSSHQERQQPGSLRVVLLSLASERQATTTAALEQAWQ